MHDTLAKVLDFCENILILLAWLEVHQQLKKILKKHQKLQYKKKKKKNPCERYI